MTLHELRLGLNFDQTVLDGTHKARKAVQAVRINSVACGLDEKLSTAPASFFRETELQQNAQQSVQQLLVRHSDHLSAIPF